MFSWISLMEGIPYTGSVEGCIIYHLWCWPNTAFWDIGSGERAHRQKQGWVPMVSYVWVLLSFSGLPWDFIHGILTFLYSFNRSFSDDSEWCIHEPFWWSVSMWLAASYVFYSTPLGIQFTIYKYIQKFTNPWNECSLQIHITTGGFASGVAAPVITLLDVAKTIPQMRGMSTEVECGGYDGCIRGHLDTGWD